MNNIFLENKYTNKYYSIIAVAQSRNLLTRKQAKEALGYPERHHIVPTCLDGSNSTDNTVFLTGREHFICHWLLTKMTTGSAVHKMIYALNGMRRANKDQLRYFTKITSRVFALAKINAAKISKVQNSKKMPDEQKAKISATTKGRPKSEEWKQKMRKPKSEQARANMKGRVNSAEQRAKQSATTKGRPKSEEHKAALRKPKSTTENMKQPKSAETKKKLSDISKAWWANKKAQLKQ